MTDVNNYVKGLITNPLVSGGDTATPYFTLGRGGEQIVTELHGKYYTAAYRGAVFSANVTAITIPVVASGLVSVFTLYNPPNSGMNAELIDFDGGFTNATTVVNVWGLYFSNSVLTAAGTFTTIGVNNTNWFNGKLGGASGAVQFYSAYTHSGTPVRGDILAQVPATAVTAAGALHKDFDGKIIIPPGIAASVATSTAAEALADLAMRWMEVPV